MKKLGTLVLSALVLWGGVVFSCKTHSESPAELDLSMQDANDKGIELDDKYGVKSEIEVEKEPLILFFQSNNYSGKNGFSLQKVEYSETADYKKFKRNTHR